MSDILEWTTLFILYTALKSTIPRIKMNKQQTYTDPPPSTALKQAKEFIVLELNCSDEKDEHG